MNAQTMPVDFTVDPMPEGTMPEATGRKRNLGGALMLSAIEDYRGVNQEAHLEAQRLLYPRNQVWQNHFDWMVSMTEGIDKCWLRDALDRERDKWDGERLRKQIRRRERLAGYGR